VFIGGRTANQQPIKGPANQNIYFAGLPESVTVCVRIHWIAFKRGKYPYAAAARIDL
jgi:hypothetical protein